MMSVQIETERRFLCSTVPAGASATETHQQTYLAVAGPLEVRVRTTTPLDGSAPSSVVAVKWRRGPDRRVEIEVPAPLRLAALLHRRLRSTVHKTRHLLEDGSQLWEIDRYHDRHAGLVAAEVELTGGTDPTDLNIPAWVGREVTGEERYSNRHLARQ